MLDHLDVASRRLRQRLDRPISNMWCFIGWICSTIVFFGVSAAFGGPVEGDVSESVYGTWTVAHGNLACIYPPSGGQQLNDLAKPFALAAPLYPLVSGMFAAILRIGHSVAFPNSSQLGPNCSRAFIAMFNWSAKSSAILPTIRLGYLVWPVIMIGVIALLRATGRGRTGWEPVALFLVACTPPLQMCLSYYFHPQDLLAMGLLLVAGACALKNRWLLAGVLIGLAFTSQQFALLVGVLLLVLVPAKSRIRYSVGALIALAVIDLPIVVATSGRGLKTVLFGSSRVGSGVRSFGGTILWETNAHGIPLFPLPRSSDRGGSRNCLVLQESLGIGPPSQSGNLRLVIRNSADHSTGIRGEFVWVLLHGDGCLPCHHGRDSGPNQRWSFRVVSPGYCGVQSDPFGPCFKLNVAVHDDFGDDPYRRDSTGCTVRRS